MVTIVSSSRYTFNKKNVKQYVASLLAEKNIELSVNIVFVGKNKMKTIASTYKNENVALPVLSFPYKGEADHTGLLGEIILCYPQAVLLAAERNKKVEPMLFQLIEHGIKNLLK